MTEEEMATWGFHLDKFVGRDQMDTAPLNKTVLHPDLIKHGFHLAEDCPMENKVLPPMKKYFEIYLPWKVYHKLWCYALSVNAEIGGLGKVRIQRTSQQGERGYRIIVEDVKIFKQEVCEVEVDLNDDMVHQFFFDLIKQGHDPKDWRLWWHSHYNFGPDFSGQDDRVIASLTVDSELISIVINQMGELRGRVDNRGVKEDIHVVTSPYDTKVMKECLRESKKLVSRAKPKKELTDEEQDIFDKLSDCASDTQQKVYDIFGDYGFLEKDLDDDMDGCFNLLPTAVQTRILDLIKEGSKKVVEINIEPFEEWRKAVDSGIDTRIKSLEGREIPTWPPVEAASITPDKETSSTEPVSLKPVSPSSVWDRLARLLHLQ